MADKKDLLSFLGGPAGAVTAGVGVLQTIGGLIGQGRSKREIERLNSQRKAFQTPSEIFDILQATQQGAQTGLGSEVLSYLTGQNERSLSAGIGASTLLGGSANDLGALLDNYNQQSMGIGAQDAAAQMANFSKYLGALNTVADNRTAEWQSTENLLKDRIQAAATKGNNATQTLQSGVNGILGSLTAGQQMGLYEDNNKKLQELINQMSGKGVLV